ncbi:hypothetical protein FSP39_017171 [Pinctada imbricata]|uniref:Uncharacterized protein n=1 Tax=Pinctada imbricata TaxID=66713 RepID=A0AA89BJI1_PINIB|nr:hypothetical protein FSP39_017171 [Pinctada imbricata]
MEKIYILGVIIMMFWALGRCGRPITAFYREPCESVCKNYWTTGTNSNNNYGSRGRVLSAYKWCSVTRFPYWDYCSLAPNETSHGSRCRTDSPCAKRGYSYYWCYSIDLSWSYCSPEVIRDEPSVTTSAYYCKNACASRGYDYFWCELNFSGIWWWDYCTTDLNFDIYGYKCNDDCGFRRYNYLWCRTPLFWQKWNYCALPESTNGTNYSRNVEQ